MKNAKRTRRTPADAPASDGVRVSTPAAAGPLVLIVDDYDDNREMYAAYLEFSGLRVAQAVNGREALSKTHDLMPDLIVMDLSLPGIDGWQATRAIKHDPKTRDILVLALTGHALEGAAQGAKDAGCDHFLTKPCLPEDLFQEIQRMLRAAPSARPKGKTRR